MAPGVIWTKEECEALNEYVKHYGKKWTPISSLIGNGKNGKQCRRQWERLNMSTKQGGWSAEEDQQLRELHSIHGNKWTHIARQIGGRTDNAVKNRFHALRMKEKTKLLARVDSDKLERLTDNVSRGRCLRHFSSLERFRASTQEQQKTDTRHLESLPYGLRPELSDGSVNGSASHGNCGVVMVKGEPPQSTGMYSSLDNSEGWNQPSAPTQTQSQQPHHLLKPESWNQPTTTCSTSQSINPYLYADMDGNGMYGTMTGGADGYYMDTSNVQRQNSFFPQEEFPDDLDSTSSSNETRQASQRDCASFCCFQNGDLLTSISGNYSSHLLSSRLARNCDLDYLCANDRMQATWSRDPYHHNAIGLSHSFRTTPRLSVDLNCLLSDGLENDMYFSKLSPTSPSAFLKPLSPAVQ